jgi:metal-responsive CopG/Arc/MetJ family transcriptional regulator
MAKHVIRKKKLGRPPTGFDPVRAVRLSDDIICRIDAWAKANGMTRSDAIRTFCEAGLKRKTDDRRRLGDA